jgi:hypothetical protein
LKVTCDFGRSDIDCIWTGSNPINLSGCTYTGWTGTAVNFTCKAPTTPGSYQHVCGLFNSAKCTSLGVNVNCQTPASRFSVQ